MSQKAAFFLAAVLPSSQLVIVPLSGDPSRAKLSVISPPRSILPILISLQVDAIAYSVNPHGFFAQAGPLRLFVSAHVRAITQEPV